MEYTLYFMLLVSIPLTIISFYSGRIDASLIFGIISLLLFVEIEHLRSKPNIDDYIMVKEFDVPVLNILEKKNLLTENEKIVSTPLGTFTIWDNIDVKKGNKVKIKYYELPVEKRKESYSFKDIAKFKICAYDQVEKRNMCFPVEILKDSNPEIERKLNLYW